ncbi:MAG: hypothetical protein IPJ77_18595 [Planctomycetes bacterium]|nr:hypothetical protein [Planctomycetota bacterium]
MNTTHARVAKSSPLAWLNLAALFLPGGLGFAAWCALRDDARLAWLDPRRGSAHFAVIATAGALATAAGVADWLHHRRGARFVGARERQVELVALAGGGAPLFLLMGCASLAERPGTFLVPVVALGVATAVAIAYDELSFHRRCSPLETAYHRALTLGMGVAWLAWMHGVFVARGAHG